MAEAYEAALVPGLIAPWAEVIASEAQIEAGMRVIDVACGSGVATRYAARLCGMSGKATGVDIDLGMIEVARTVATSDNLPTEYHYGSASELPFDSESFDAALCLQGLQYFPDQPKAMAELHRVMQPNSRLVVITWSEMQSCKGYWAMISALERRNIDATAMRKPFALSDPVAMRALAEDAGFKRVAIRTEQRPARFPSARCFVDAMAQGAPSSRHALAHVPTAEWSNFLSEVEDALAPWQRDTCVEFPMECNVLEAHH
ncbi:MAG: methyltransferase domain-containing protein [Rhodanobacter sp.]